MTRDSLKADSQVSPAPNAGLVVKGVGVALAHFQVTTSAARSFAEQRRPFSAIPSGANQQSFSSPSWAGVAACSPSPASAAHAVLEVVRRSHAEAGAARALRTVASLAVAVSALRAVLVTARVTRPAGCGAAAERPPRRLRPRERRGAPRRPDGPGPRTLP
jgi:hypothetical protein